MKYIYWFRTSANERFDIAMDYPDPTKAMKRAKEKLAEQLLFPWGFVATLLCYRVEKVPA